MEREENERLCQTGKGTPMGEALRRYWMPVCLSTDLPERNGAPFRVRMLGENFVAFRGDDGKVGILDERCIHRGASLMYARNEDSALRCIYHGWKYAADGTIVELPNVADDRIKNRLRLRALPVEESHNLVWAYLGPLGNAGEDVPPRPKYEWESYPEEQTLVWPMDLDCNWVQALESLIDSAHLNFLHADRLIGNYAGNYGNVREVKNFQASTANTFPRLEVEETDFGFHYAAIRRDGGESAGHSLVRITTYAAPCLVFVPPGYQGFMMLPTDDTHCRMLNIWFSATERLVDGPGRDYRLKRWGVLPEALAATGTNAVMPGQYPAPPRNNIPQDRKAMQEGRSINGISGLHFEDALMTTSMGFIADRTVENLIPTDVAIVKFRRLMLDGARRAEGGSEPLGTRPRTATAKIRASAGEMPNDGDWRKLAPKEHQPLSEAVA